MAAASLGVDAKGGIRSAVGIPTTATRLILPGVADAGPSDLALFDPARTAARYRVTVLGPSGPAPATGLVSQQLAPGSARTEHVTAGARALVVVASAGITAARRSFGLQGDQGSTSGALRAASAWVVPGAAFAGDNETRLYLANPGTRRVSVSVYALSRGSAPSPARTVDVPPGSTVLVDPKPGPQVASIVAVAKSGTFVPAEASYTARGIGFAVVTGVPIPTRWIPRG